MLVDPNEPKPQPLPSPSVMGADEIVGHVDRAMQSLPPEAQGAVAHAHGLVSGNQPLPAIPPMLAASPEITPSDSSPIGIAPPTVPNSPMSQFGDPGFKPSPLPNTRVMPDDMRRVESPSSMAPVYAPELPLPNARQVPPRMELLESPRMMGPQVERYEPLPSAAAVDLKRMRDTGSGSSQVHNPFLKTLATIADVVGSGLFPQFAQFVPGSSAHHDMLIANREAQVKDEQTQQKAADESALQQAQTDETASRAKQEEARAEAALHPPDPKEWTQVTEPIIDPLHPEAGPQIAYVNKNDPSKVRFLGKAAAKPTEPKQPTNELEAWIQAPENKGKPIAGVLDEFWTAKAKATGQEKAKPLSKETADTLNAAWNSLATKYHMAENPFREGMSDSEVKHVQDSFNAIVGRNQGAINLSINQGKAEAAKAAKQDAQTQKLANEVHKRLTTGFDTLVAQSEGLDQAIKEIGGSAPGQAVGVIKSIVNLAGGKGSGVRVTQAELDSLVKARGLADTFGGWLSGIQGKGKMDAHQVQQIKDILAEVKARADEKRGLYFDSLKDLSEADTPRKVHDIENRFNESLMRSGGGQSSGSGGWKVVEVK